LFIIFQNLFYVPIIIACMYYTRRGLAFSVAISFVYLFLIIGFATGSTVILQASIRVVIFIGIAVVTTLLAEKCKNAEAELQRHEQNLERLVEERTRELARANQKLKTEMAERQQAEDERALNSQRVKTLLRLNQMTDATLQQITDFALEEAVRLTRSTIGYLAFLNEDESILTMHSWSKSAMKECAIHDKPIVYPVASTGLWGEAVRQRQPVITNDYSAASPLKKGCPEGHVLMERHMNTPVFDGSRIVIVAGVGNKADNYDNGDVQQLTLLMEGMWRLLAQRKATEEIRILNAELEQRVLDRTTELVSVNQKLIEENSARQQAEVTLRARNEDLKDFAYTISHDLKAPLRGIAGYSAELQRKHSEGLSERARFCLHQIHTATGNLDHLIEDLLHYSRLDAETPSLAHVDLLNAITEILQDRTLTIKEQGIEVTIDTNDVQVETWERGIVQILTNLIDNAIKYSRNAQPPRLTITACEIPNAFRLTVADNGIGFDMKYHDRIFGLFNRLVRPSEFEGTGAGLAIVKKLVDKLGGTIRAESAPDQGATFFVEIPSDQPGRTTP
jgi:signal transduction histidine kinase